MTQEDRGLVGVMVFLVLIGLAMIYLMITSSLLGGLDDSPITNDASFSDSDAMIDATEPYERLKDVAFIAVPLIMIGSGAFFAFMYYLRRERTGGSIRGP